MKVDDIRIRAQITSGLQINSVTALQWVKEAIEDICSTYYQAGKTVTETTTVTDPSVNYTLLKPLLKLLGVKDSDLNDVSYTLNADNTITFDEAGTYTIGYKALPDMPETTSSDVPLPFLYVPCIEFFLAYKMRARVFGQNDNNAVGFSDKYEMGKANAEIARLRQDKKRRIPWGRGI
jgi:hypothetical protein